MNNLLQSAAAVAREPGFWSAITVLLWAVVAIVVWLLLRSTIDKLAGALTLRIRSGAAVKLGTIELEAIRVVQEGPVGSEITTRPAPADWEKRRDDQYSESKGVFLVHKLFPSEQPGQLYDILIYVLPHRARAGTLKSVRRVDYYLGRAWGNRIFTTSDFGKRFGILISAFGGGFICAARIHFLDGTEMQTWRYIDFEGGNLGDHGESPSAPAA